MVDLTRPIEIELGSVTGSLLVSVHETDGRGRKITVPINGNRVHVMRLLKNAPKLLEMLKRQSGFGNYVTQTERLALIEEIEQGLK